MSQRFGMADGRCFTIGTASGLLNDFIMEQNGIRYEDNYSYRKLLQDKGPDALSVVTGQQGILRGQCSGCDTALLKVPNTY